jgi:large subunit ribosomal protein L35
MLFVCYGRHIGSDKMPKMKTKRAVAKRFSLTASGKLKKRRSGLRHILEKKSHKAKKRAGKTDYVAKADVKSIKKMIPYA